MRTLTIKSLEVLELKIPFRFTFRHSLAERSIGHSILVRAKCQNGQVGFGECVPRSYVTGETPESVIGALRSDLAPPWIGKTFASFEEVTHSISNRLSTLPRNRHAAFCALELALLDLAGRNFDCSAGSVLGEVINDELEYSGVVSADGTEAALKMLSLIKDFGFGRVKIKVGGTFKHDQELLERARDLLGPQCRLRIDANCAWTAKEALTNLEALASLGLESVEQPVAGDDLEGLAFLTKHSPTPIIVDESLASVEDAQRLIEANACHHFNVRISKCGGLVNSAKIRDLAQSASIGCQLGAQVGETVLLTAAGRHFGTRSPNLLFAEGSFGTFLLQGDIGEQDLTLSPHHPAAALRGPGLGVDVNVQALTPWLTQTLTLGDA